MTIITVNGHTYSDDGTQSRDMLYGGFRTWLFPLVQDTLISFSGSLAIAAQAVTDAQNYASNAAASAVAASAGPGTSSTSTTSLTIGIGSKSLTIQTGKSIVPGMNIIIANTVAPDNSMFGPVTSYNSGTGALVVNVTQVAGSGTGVATWSVSLSGPATPVIINELKGVDVASAGTINLDATTGNLVHVTGTTTITAITLASGRERKVVFDAALTLTYNVTSLILPGAANIVTAAGDSMIIVGDGAGNVRVVSYNRANSFPGQALRSPRTSNTALGSVDIQSFVDITSGTFTQTLVSAAALGAGWYCKYRNSGTGVVTLDPNGAETIDGQATRNCYPQEEIVISTDGSNFFVEVLHPFYFKPSATVTFVQPSGYIEIESDLLGASGGAGSGYRGSSGIARSGGAPGGAPGRVVRRHRNIAPNSSIVISLGAPGVGGAAQTVNDTLGNDGTAGGNTTFGSLSTAFGGAAGRGGAQGISTVASTSGSGSLGAGTSTSGGGGPLGGAPRFAINGQDSISTGGGGTGSSGGNSEWGGAGSVSDAFTTAVLSSGSSIYGVSAAGPGGHITSGDQVPANGGMAGLNGTYTKGGGALGGTCGGTPTVGVNGAPAATDDLCGNSGGGGGSSITAAAQKGGDGGAPGGAPGGGGASFNGFPSGAGGAGAIGRAIIKGVV